MTNTTTGQAEHAARERFVRVLVAQIFLIFFQGFMVAPLLPRLSALFGASIGTVSRLVPAYMLPYGVVCLVVGPLADWFGRTRVLRVLLVASVVLPALTATATSLPSLLMWRALTGLFLGGLTPVGLALIADLFPYEERGRPVGWVFGAIAGGMAFGATVAPWLETALGWRGLFVLVAVLATFAAFAAWGPIAAAAPVASVAPIAKRGDVDPHSILLGYLRLLGTRRGATLYGLVLMNGAFHGGVFAWLGVYFVERYALAPRELGFALLGYGIPGFFLGPVIGRLADRHGRRGMIRSGLVLAALCALFLSARLPVLAATACVTLLSVGFDLTHPLFSGMISALDRQRPAQAMALNTFAVFVGMGTGSMLFGAAYAHLGMTQGLIVFGSVQLVLALATLRLFDSSWR